MSVAERLSAHCARLPRAVLYRVEAAQLLDVPSGKTLALRHEDVVSVQPTEAGLTLWLRDGRTVSLDAVGVTFAPQFSNTGAVPGLPPRVGFELLSAKLLRLKRDLYATGAPSEATVRDLMACLAIVDGARAVGFDVAAEDAQLSWHLEELERLAPEG